MPDLSRIRPLDALIAVVAALVVLIGGFLAFSVWSSNRTVATTSPASRAVEDYMAKVRKSPNDVKARMGLAQALTVAGRDNDAIEEYQQVVKAHPAFTPALSGIGFIYMKQKAWATGERYFRRVIDLTVGTENASHDPQLEIAYFYLGTALMEQKKYEEAVAQFKAALRLRSDASDTWYALSVCYRALHIDDQYERALRTALTFDPTMPEANYDLGQLLLARGDVAGAAEHFRTSADAAPAVEKPQAALDALGDAGDRRAAAQRLEKSDPKKALVEARVAVALDPSSVDGLLLLGRLYETTKDDSQAVDVYRKVLALDVKNAVAVSALKRVGK